MTEYKGPNFIKDDIQLALQNLTSLLAVKNHEYDHHCVICVDGLDNGKPVIKGIAVYLVGAIASCIEFNLSLREALFDEKSIARDLYRDVTNIIGNDNDIGNSMKTNERNPWIWEGISHLIIHISQNKKETHPPGYVLAKSSIHLNVKDHGLDIIVLYEADNLGVTAGECKAYLKRSADAIADAANRLREVDEGSRDAEIRSSLAQFRPSLLPEQQEKLAGSFWRNERAYFPMVCCDSEYSTDWTKKRVSLERLNVPSKMKFLVPAEIYVADEFFDSIAEEMRQYCT